MGSVEDVLNTIIEHLRVFYKWPSVFAVKNCYVEVLSKGRVWYKYDDLVESFDFALLYEGLKNVHEESEFELIEAEVRYLESIEILYSFLDEPEEVHIYDVRPMGNVVKVYARFNGKITFTDTSQLRQYIASRLKAQNCI